MTEKFKVKALEALFTNGSSHSECHVERLHDNITLSDSMMRACAISLMGVAMVNIMLSESMMPITLRESVINFCCFHIVFVMLRDSMTCNQLMISPLLRGSVNVYNFSRYHFLLWL